MNILSWLTPVKNPNSEVASFGQFKWTISKRPPCASSNAQENYVEFSVLLEIANQEGGGLTWEMIFAHTFGAKTIEEAKDQAQERTDLLTNTIEKHTVDSETGEMNK